MTTLRRSNSATTLPPPPGRPRHPAQAEEDGRHRHGPRGFPAEGRQGQSLISPTSRVHSFTVPDYGPPPPRSPLSRYLNTNAMAAANEKCSRKPSGRDRTRHPTDRRTDATRRPREILQPPTFLRSSKQADARRATGRTWDSYPSSGVNIILRL